MVLTPPTAMPEWAACPQWSPLLVLVNYLLSTVTQDRMRSMVRSLSTTERIQNQLLVVPVVHIVGTPSTLSQKNGMLLHHTLGNGDFNV